jgi:hypothetical protein
LLISPISTQCCKGRKGLETGINLAGSVEEGTPTIGPITGFLKTSITSGAGAGTGPTGTPLSQTISQTAGSFKQDEIACFCAEMFTAGHYSIPHPLIQINPFKSTQTRPKKVFIIAGAQQMFTPSRWASTPKTLLLL